jgi:hypothetical protein
MLKILTVWIPNELYTKDWLLKIQDSISRNLSVPHEHICLTDEILDHCKTIPFGNDGPELDGYWFKIKMFRNHPELLGPCLYFDLDLVISGPLDEMVLSLLKSDNDSEIFGAKDPFVGATAITPKHFFNSSILFWKKNPTHLWDRFITNRVKVWKMSTKDEHTHGDQAYIATFAKIGFVNDFCAPAFIARINDYQEGVTSVIFFAGKKKPNSYLENLYIKKHWRIGK